MLPRRLLPLLFALALAATAGAQSVENVLAEAGLLGRWANDCSRPAGGGNIHTIYAAGPGGEVTLSYDHGAGSTPTVNRIESAQRLSPERLAYHQENRSSGVGIDIELAISPTHIRVWTSRQSTGQLLVENGKFTSDGLESPLHAKCR
ncbi:MAG: hypothetical protein HYR88_05990 [Verrucomicrobia bacterium]|nr:hypothetical protein [Verrucomicrobiota bacterium]